MHYIIKNLKTHEEETLELRDLMLGVTQEDDAIFLLLSSGETRRLWPAADYEVSAAVEEPPTPEPDPPTLEERKARKLAELSAACNTSITAGCDVTLADGTSGHISMTDEDQINLMSAMSTVAAGAAGYPYHLDGALCRIYAAIVLFDWLRWLLFGEKLPRYRWR